MTGLTVLNELEARALLENLTYDEFESFREPLGATLHDYSTGMQSAQDGGIHQPRRTSITSTKTGETTVFVPASNVGGVSMKVLTYPDHNDRDDDSSNPPGNPSSLARARGAITLFNKAGDPVGLVPAQTVTAFRTALASSCLLTRRKRLRQITVFGCGEQAYWHVRLALLLRGASVRQVNIINRRFSEHARLIFKRLASTPARIKEREGWADCKIGLLTPGYGEFARLREEHLVDSDAIFCCTPSTEPLFDAKVLTNYEARARGRVIVAIGSYRKDMRELPVELLRQATRAASKGGHHHHHKHAIEGGVVVVDTLDGALQEAGEIIEAGLQPNQLVELGELVMLRRDAFTDGSFDDSTENLCSVPAAEFEKLNMSCAGTSSGSSESPKSSIYSHDTASTTTSASTPATTTISASPSSSQHTLLPSPHPHDKEQQHSGGGEHGTHHHGHEKKHQHQHQHQHRRQHSRSSHGEHNSNGAGGSGARKSSGSETDHLHRWMASGNIVYKSVGLGLMDLAVGMRLIELAKEKGVGTYIEGF